MSDLALGVKLGVTVSTSWICTDFGNGIWTIFKHQWDIKEIKVCLNYAKVKDFTFYIMGKY